VEVATDFYRKTRGKEKVCDAGCNHTTCQDVLLLAVVNLQVVVFTIFFRSSW